MQFQLAIVVLAFLLAGCGGGGGSSVPVEPPVVQLPPTMSQLSFLVTENAGLESDLTLTEIDRVFSGRTLTNAPINELVASFQHDGVSASIGGVTQVSGTTANNFTDLVTYRITGSGAQTTSYQVDLTKFTNLPIVYLKTDYYAAIDSKEDYVPGDASIVGGRNFDDLAQVEMEIRGRGNSTWGLHPKKPFQMKLSDKAEFLGMPNDKKWLFLAEYSDKTMLRNKISFEMGYISNLDWTPQGRFAEVYINDEYNGTYNITQKVEESDNRVALGDTGYLLELDQLSRLDPDDVYFESTVTDKFMINIKEPNVDLNSSEYLYVKDLIGDFESAMFGSSFLSNTEGYVKYIDVDSFVDWYLISEITKNVDSKFFSSMFLNVMPGEKIKMGPLWDFDLSFGNVDYADSRYAEGWWVKYHPWYERLFQDPAFVAKVKVRFAYFKDNQAFILNKIDAYAQQLRWAQQENDDKWQTLGVYVWPNPVIFNTYQEEVDHMKYWYINRMDWLEAAFGNL
ncbi:MAG: CotH kinase family protein [Proteobacteria bacterium]|nr:CotH kinase family protein [Pseudomonadota bacterium]MDA1351080.1 CotH kinase family protein [Pseudomonadota bacterium]